uniref:Zinc finger protein 385B-like n=1 Tax=Geotrypetes seraphini TaxID=260995 RepID=A0A6P8RIF6_GEOSA|nr:zinc finger protein 385B-like [Geotrypetes seraphini]
MGPLSSAQQPARPEQLNNLETMEVDDFASDQEAEALPQVEEMEILDQVFPEQEAMEIGMKHPLSPDFVLENGNMNSTTFLWSFEENGQQHDGPNYQLNNETKKVLFSLCEVCNIQLNTAAQAEVHYSGKSHLKRMKQLNNGKLPTNTAPSSLLVSTSTAFTLITQSRAY